jgi:hypothetical protein
MDNEVTDFPEPDSPTIARISPLETDISIFFNAFVVELSVTKSTDRFLICRSGADMCKNNWEILELGDFEIYFPQFHPL